MEGNAKQGGGVQITNAILQVYAHWLVGGSWGKTKIYSVSLLNIALNPLLPKLFFIITGIFCPDELFIRQKDTFHNINRKPYIKMIRTLWRIQIWW